MGFLTVLLNSNYIIHYQYNMSYIIVFVIEFLVALMIAILWANGIDKMPKDYKGEDFLNWDKEEENEGINKR